MFGLTVLGEESHEEAEADENHYVNVLVSAVVPCDVILVGDGRVTSGQARLVRREKTPCT